jgi:uncharacterized protein (TIRG00374 family)
LRKYVKFIVLVLITIAIFWFFGRNLDWQEISAALRKANPYYLGLAFLGICLGYFLRAVRWQVLLSPIVGAKIRDLFATTTVGFTAILFVGRAGEIVRPMWLPMRDKRIRPSAALVTIFVERVFDLASLMAFFSISLMFFRTPEGRETEFASIKLAGNIIVAIIVAGIIGMIIYHRYSAQIIDWVEAFTDRQFVPKRVRYVFLSLMRNMATALDILKRPREIILAAFWTTALWVAIAIPTWLVLMAFDLPMTFLDSTFVMGVASLGTLIPTPGGAAGAFHAATAGSLIILGVDREQAAAVSIIMHLIYFAPALVFGLYYLFHGDISIERFRSLLSSENAEKEIESDSPDFEKVNSEQ